MVTKTVEANPQPTAPAEASVPRAARTESVVATGSIVGAVAASSCCILPVALFSLGAGGAWIGNLAALAPYQWIFVAFTAVCLAAGFYLAYRKPRGECADDASCVRPLPRRIVRGTLWSASVLVLAAIAFPYYAPLLLGG